MLLTQPHARWVARGQRKCSRERLCRGQRLPAEAGSTGAVVFELDGGVIDLHMDGHRVAFNRSLTSLGYECAQFNPPIYNDLLQAGDGTAEGLVKAYFDCMGWPTMLATSERGLFMKKICETKTKMLSQMLQKDEVPLRTGVDQVIRDALSDSMAVVLVAGTQSDVGDEVAQSALRQLGPDTARHVKVFNCNVAAGDGEAEGGGEVSGSSLSQALKDASAREKQRSASAFIQSLKDEEATKSLPLALDINLLASNRRTVSVEFLAAITAALGVKMASSLVIASSLGVAQAGCAAGIATVAIPRRMGAQGSFPGVAAKMEAYGTGYATWPRLKAVLKSAGAGK